MEDENNMNQSQKMLLSVDGIQKLFNEWALEKITGIDIYIFSDIGFSFMTV